MRKQALHVRARRFGELRAKRAANPGAQAALPTVKPFEERSLTRWRRSTSAELVRAFDLLKELEGIVHPVNAELQRIYVQRAKFDARLPIRGKGPVGAEGKVRFVLTLAKARRRDGQQQH